MGEVLREVLMPNDFSSTLPLSAEKTICTKAFPQQIYLRSWGRGTAW